MTETKRLAFRLDLHSGVPVYRQIIDQVLGGMASGKLAAGDQLPTVRQVAVDLAINPNTVVRAYRELEIRGVLETQQGTGTFIAQRKVTAGRCGAPAAGWRNLSRNLWRGRAAPDSLSQNLRSNSMIYRMTCGKEDRMALKRARKCPSAASAPPLACSASRPESPSEWPSNNPAPAWCRRAIGLYLMFAIRVADQWEKVAVLRLGRYIGLRGPGMFHIIPDRGYAEPLRGPARAGGQRHGRIGAHARYGAGERGRHRVLGGVERREIHPGSGRLHRRHHHERADGAAGIHRPARACADDHRARDAGPRVAAHPRREDQSVGHHGAVGGDPRRAHSAELEDAMSRQAQAERERQARIILGQAETEIADNFAQAAVIYQDNPVALHLRAMNMLYEAIKEKGSMVIVPSSAVETMGLGGMLATSSLAGNRPQV